MLAQIIRENLNPPQRTVRQLRGGLALVFRPREATCLRIVATRYSFEPSDKELAILHREIVTAVADVPLATVGTFERKPARDDWHAAEIWINFAPVNEVNENTE